MWRRSKRGSTNHIELDNYSGCQVLNGLNLIPNVPESVYGCAKKEKIRVNRRLRGQPFVDCLRVEHRTVGEHFLRSKLNEDKVGIIMERRTSMLHSNPSVWRIYRRLSDSFFTSSPSWEAGDVETSSSLNSATLPSIRNVWPMAYFSSKKNLAASGDVMETVEVAIQATLGAGALEAPFTGSGVTIRCTRRVCVTGVASLGTEGYGFGSVSTQIR